MKTFFSFLTLSLLISISASAQTTVRKIPFLPYAGSGATGTAAGVASGINTGSTEQPFSKNPITKPYETVMFNEGSADIRPDQREKIIQIGKRLEKEGGAFFTIVSFSTPDISNQLAGKRAQVVAEALRDFKVGETLYRQEYRKRPVINPNRIEVYMK